MDGRFEHGKNLVGQRFARGRLMQALKEKIVTVTRVHFQVSVPYGWTLGDFAGQETGMVEKMGNEIVVVIDGDEHREDASNNEPGLPFDMVLIDDRRF